MCVILWLGQPENTHSKENKFPRVNIPGEERAVLLVISCFQLRSLRPDPSARPELVSGTLSVTDLNKGEPEGSAQHPPGELEPSSEPLESSRLHDLALWIQSAFRKKKKKKEKQGPLDTRP